MNLECNEAAWQNIANLDAAQVRIPAASASSSHSRHSTRAFSLERRGPKLRRREARAMRLSQAQNPLGAWPPRKVSCRAPRSTARNTRQARPYRRSPRPHLCLAPPPPLRPQALLARQQAPSPQQPLTLGRLAHRWEDNRQRTRRMRPQTLLARQQAPGPTRMMTRSRLEA